MSLYSLCCVKQTTLYMVDNGLSECGLRKDICNRGKENKKLDENDKMWVRIHSRNAKF